MASLNEKLRDAWSVLRGLKTITREPQDGARSIRYGSDPATADDDLSLASASYEFYRNWTHLEPDRLSVYSDMDELFTYVLGASALEAYVEDAIQEDFKSGLIVTPESSDPQVVSHLINLFDRLELDDRVMGDMWSMAKYGDNFGLVMVDENKGVFDAAPLEPRIVWRQEDSRRVLKGFSVGDASENTTDSQLDTPKYKPWDIVHWRLRSRRIIDPYGSPFFYNVRMIYKVLKLMEEQMVIYRMNMHPDRLVFKVFTGGAGPEERKRQVRMWRREMEKNTSLDRASGQFRSEYAPWMVNQNIYWPVGQGDDKSGVEKFAGSANAGDIFDVAYMRDLFFAGVRVPKGYMGFEDSQGYRGTDTLSAQSIKFARGVKRLQKHYLQGLTRLCKLHLATQGIDSRRPEHSFTLKMTPPSYLDEAHRAELYAKRYEALNYMIDIGTKMSEELDINRKFWAEYVLTEFGGFDDETLAKLTSPDMAAEPDATYVPSDHALTFEGEKAEAEAKIRDMVGNDKGLQEAVNAVRQSEQTTPVKYRSGADQLILPKDRKELITDPELIAEARQVSDKHRIRLDKEERDKVRSRRERLQSLAENWQGE